MRLSRYFLPVLKENPSEAQIVSHRYMLRAGMIKQASAGIYSWLPLGYRVLKRIEQIVHEEQVRAGHGGQRGSLELGAIRPVSGDRDVQAPGPALGISDDAAPQVRAGEVDGPAVECRKRHCPMKPSSAPQVVSARCSRKKTCPCSKNKPSLCYEEGRKLSSEDSRQNHSRRHS